MSKYIWYNQFVIWFGDVAQLARATGSYPVGREFESLRRYHYDIN